jgi:hypothetical protein
MDADKVVYGLTPRETGRDRKAVPQLPTEDVEKARAEYQRRHAEADFKETVNNIAESLADGRITFRGIRGHLNLSLDPTARDAKPRATHLTLWPLEPTSIEDAVRCGLLNYSGIQRHVYERMVAQLPGRSGEWLSSREVAAGSRG